MNTHRELHDLEEQIKAVRVAQSDLDRLETFLMDKLKALRGELTGRYGSVMAGVGVSDGEVQARVLHAAELAARWGKR